MPVCKICGKNLKNPNSKNHINSKFHQEKLKQQNLSKQSTSKIDSNIEIRDFFKELLTIKSRLTSIENRLKVIEDFYDIQNKEKNKIRISGISNLWEIIKHKIPEISNNILGIEKVSIGKLYQKISNDHIIPKEDFEKALIKLNDSGKIQLEAGTNEDDFSIKDNYGNVYKLIRLL
ncbi:MAG: hypothetical protein ACTSPD_20055 [Promethearchaeota archaeon]